MSSSLPYMQLYIADYLADTAHLSTLEHGAYMLLLMNYWQRGEPLPAHDAKLARIARISLKDWACIKDTLADLFVVSDLEWRHKRVERELEIVRTKQEQARNAGRTSAERRSNDRSTDAQRPFNGRSTTVQRTLNDRSTTRTRSTIPESDTDTERNRGAKAPLSADADDGVLKTAVEAYNATADRCGLPHCQTLNKRRKSSLLARLQECGGIDGWLIALAKLEASPHCRGENDRGWRADFDFLIQAKSFTRLMEGSYDKRTPAARPNSIRDSWQQAEEYLKQRDGGEDGSSDDNLMLSRLPAGPA